MLHERVGHDGLGLLLNAPGDRPGQPNINRLRWENLVRGMPQHLLEGIANEPGYEHLKGNQQALALEWFARAAEERPELLTQPSLVMRMWDNFKQGVVDLMLRLGLEPLKGQELDAQVMTLLQRARQAAVEGGGAQNGAANGAAGQGLQFSMGGSGSAPKKSNTTRRGVKRNNPRDWKQVMQLWDDLGYSDLLSPSNRDLIRKRLVPIVDDAWISYHPEDAGLKGEIISIHHVDGLPLSGPLPYSRHLDAHMPGGFRDNPGGIGSQLPIYPAQQPPQTTHN